MSAALDHLMLGFSTALTPGHLVGCLIGALVGTMIGVLPGLGPVTTIALLLPLTFSLTPTGAVIMLAGIYYGAQYGGSISAILVNVPGEASSTVTCLDGYAMARQGRAGLALAVSAIGSFVGGTVGTLVLATLSVPLTSLASHFEAADYAALMACGLATAIVLASGPMVKALLMVAAGTLLGAVGTDPTGQPRFTLGRPELLDGIGFMPTAIGLFALSEIIAMLIKPAERVTTTNAVDGLWPQPGEARRATRSSLRGTILGSLLGILPGAGPLIASFAGYALEKKISPRAPFGLGAIEGVAGPESANNAAAQTSFVPDAWASLERGDGDAPGRARGAWHSAWTGRHREGTGALLGARGKHVDRQPPAARDQPSTGRHLAPIAPDPYRFLYPATIVLCCVGIYTLNHSTFELFLAAGFGGIGYALRAYGFEPTPLLLGFVLSQPLEEHFRRAMLFSDNDVTTFLSHPVSATLVALTVLLLVLSVLPAIRRTRQMLQ